MMHPPDRRHTVRSIRVSPQVVRFLRDCFAWCMAGILSLHSLQELIEPLFKLAVELITASLLGFTLLLQLTSVLSSLHKAAWAVGRVAYAGMLSALSSVTPPIPSARDRKIAADALLHFALNGLWTWMIFPLDNDVQRLFFGAESAIVSVTEVGAYVNGTWNNVTASSVISEALTENATHTLTETLTESVAENASPAGLFPLLLVLYGAVCSVARLLVAKLGLVAIMVRLICGFVEDDLQAREMHAVEGTAAQPLPWSSKVLVWILHVVVDLMPVLLYRMLKSFYLSRAYPSLLVSFFLLRPLVDAFFHAGALLIKANASASSDPERLQRRLSLFEISRVALWMVFSVSYLLIAGRDTSRRRRFVLYCVAFQSIVDFFSPVKKELRSWLSDQQIDKECRAVTQEELQRLLRENDQCAVCLCDHTETSRVLRCGHILHRDCLRRICTQAPVGRERESERRRCPICRAHLFASDATASTAQHTPANPTETSFTTRTGAVTITQHMHTTNGQGNAPNQVREIIRVRLLPPPPSSTSRNTPTQPATSGVSSATERESTRVLFRRRQAPAASSATTSSLNAATQAPGTPAPGTQFIRLNLQNPSIADSSLETILSLVDELQRSGALRARPTDNERGNETNGSLSSTETPTVTESPMELSEEETPSKVEDENNSSSAPLDKGEEKKELTSKEGEGKTEEAKENGMDVQEESTQPLSSLAADQTPEPEAQIEIKQPQEENTSQERRENSKKRKRPLEVEETPLSAAETESEKKNARPRRVLSKQEQLLQLNEEMTD